MSKQNFLNCIERASDITALYFGLEAELKRASPMSEGDVRDILHAFDRRKTALEQKRVREEARQEREIPSAIARLGVPKIKAA
jgi:hypothetical protein